MNDFLGPLYGVDRVPAGDEDLLLYWAIPAARDIANFVWDTDVPEVTLPWPQMEPSSLRDAMVMVLGSEDVTGHLYLVEELESYEASMKPCTGLCINCGRVCGDKWCGLRGDTEGFVVADIWGEDHGFDG